MKAFIEDLRIAVLARKRDILLKRLSKKPISKAEVIELEQQNAGSRQTCHIIGSGWSLADSLDLIDSRDYVVGYNLAALSGVGCNAYFIERIAERVPGIDAFYSDMLQLAGVKGTYLKNLHERGATIKSMNHHIDRGAIPCCSFNVGGYFRVGEERGLAEYLLTGGRALSSPI